MVASNQTFETYIMEDFIGLHILGHLQYPSTTPHYFYTRLPSYLQSVLLTSRQLTIDLICLNMTPPPPSTIMNPDDHFPKHQRRSVSHAPSISLFTDLPASPLVLPKLVLQAAANTD
ncbi:uncharacterized protein LY89DRAFT_123816 [Mollisia scopiformis]|uniref:Uncharacterized protein n=1 Tax=Mollisia scopiformis TaxID=149040 RepID=A0A194X453_MOLSC|nr:uncharacterized protein LY89DRAFT_123816 [Mollisia scopiformis]KUJ14839.1 hypothetical protein LY89DRAFT_123816 [Mollisia scopiformis]